ncbi:MAG: hypothetical protein JXA93_09885 [Anaerolineae bacterium]|nr:hypothetical protein [Anaerolineae bacterium]
MSEQDTQAQKKRPYFLWDYDLSEEEVRAILRGSDEVEKAWLITRILEYARWDDIWRYLTVDDLWGNLHRLHFRWPRDRELWTYALKRWRGHA